MSNPKTLYYKLTSKKSDRVQHVSLTPHPNNDELYNMVSIRKWDNNNREASTSITSLRTLVELYHKAEITRDQWIYEFAITISEMCSAACISDFQINIK